MTEVEKKPAIPQLDATRFQPAEHERNIHAITVEEHVTRANILTPEFLAHVAAKLRPYDQIEVRKDDGTLFARLLVLQADRTWARTYVLEWHNLTTRDVSLTAAVKGAVGANPANQDSPFEVTYKGAHKKWFVLRKDTTPPEYIREGEEPKTAASAWLNQWLKVTT